MKICSTLYRPIQFASQVLTWVETAPHDWKEETFLVTFADEPNYEAPIDKLQRWLDNLMGEVGKDDVNVMVRHIFTTDWPNQYMVILQAMRD